LVDIVRGEPAIELAELQRRLGLGSVNTVKADIKALESSKRITFKDHVFTVI
jgi:hypothetical protein